MPTLQINVYEKKIIKLVGKLNINNYYLIKKEIDKNIVFECNLIFDLTECDYISSSGLRVLMIISKKIEKVKGKGVINGITDIAKDIIYNTGFDNIFKNLKIL